LETKQLKITNLFTYKYVIIPHTKRGRDKKKKREAKKTSFSHSLPTKKKKHSFSLETLEA
jgi:hypothetical protein